MNDLAKGVASIKAELVKTYTKNNHLYEAIPTVQSEIFSASTDELESLHQFAKNNPIYSSTSNVNLLGVDCIVYEGDINNYWLDSIKHDTSYAPFYPTWILSAFVLARKSKDLGVNSIVDIGSGDGRIAYCNAMCGIRSYGIEIDENLSNLQKEIVKKSNVPFEVFCADATRFDYTTLNLKSPAFFIGGLPENGEILAQSIVDNTNISNSTFVLTGTNTIRKNKDNSQWGWASLIKKFKLDVIDTIDLPTRWTLDQPKDTPYVFVRNS